MNHFYEGSGVIKKGSSYFLGGRIQGFSHIRDNIPCQDSFVIEAASAACGQFMLMAVADGHGGARHCYSEKGSVYAAKTAVWILKKFLRIYGDSIDVLYRAIKSDFPAEVMRHWREIVYMDYNKRPDMIIGLTPREILAKYGTTLMFSAVLADNVIFGKLGDGNIVVVNNHGEVIDPIPDEPSLVGGATYSMCGQKAMLPKWDVKYRKGFSLLTISTDGLCNSFKDDADFFGNVKDTWEYIKNGGIYELSQNLEQFLTYCTVNGSSDDITTVFAFRG